MSQKISYMIIGAIFGAMVFAGSAHAADKPAPKVDCTQKKNANKIECKKAPEPKKKVEAKKPEKVERKAPKAVQQKADANNKK